MEKVVDLKEREIREFLEQDIIDLKFFPTEEVRKRFSRSHKIDFTEIHTEKSLKEFKDILVNVLYYGKPYTINSNGIYGIFRLPLLIADCEGLTSISIDKIPPLAHALGKSTPVTKIIIQVATKCQEFLFDLYDTRSGFDKDIWDDSTFTLSEERINKSNPKYTFNFRRNIENKENRDLAKCFLKYLIGNTEMGLSTIINYFSTLCIYCNFLGEMNILDVSKEKFKEFAREISSFSDDTYNRRINIINNIYKYFAVKKLLKKENPVDLSLLRPIKQDTLERSVSEHVILQIFNNLHKASDEYRLMYLINYCTGMRVSDVCQLRTDSLYEDGENGYYIRPYRCQKMRNTIMNLIPKALYELIEAQIKKINTMYPDCIYLFPSERDKTRPYLSKTFINNFKALCSEWGITNEDGTPYNYRTHDYRHTISTDLYQNYNVPIITIQKAVLWHQEIQMSLSYVERPDSFRKMQEDTYISRVGESNLPDEVRETLKNHILPNGVCTMNDTAGICPAVDACLSCPNFRTSKEFLHVHKQQLSTIQSKLIIFEANGWENNIITARRQISELEEIIKKIEEMEDEKNASTKN